MLKNARSNQEYDLNLVVNQGVEFLSSDRGAFIRDRLVDEFFNSVDALSKNALHNFTYVLREKVGITAVHQIPSASVEQQQTLEYIKRIAGILRDTKGFDATKFAPQLAQIIVNPGVQLLSQQIATRVTQKAVTRVIRDLLASE